MKIYTDGACHPPTKTGCWGVLILQQGVPDEVLHEIVKDTTHQRMELLAVIEATKLAIKQQLNEVTIYTDSQYVVDLPNRRAKLEVNNYLTKAGKRLQNADLLETFFELSDRIVLLLVKVKAHQKQTNDPNPNRTIDRWVRKKLREYMGDYRTSIDEI